MLQRFKSKRLRRLITGGPSADTVILMYHRIGDAWTDPWEVTVSPAHFREHLAVLQRGYQLQAFSPWMQERATSDNGRTVLITFDDGYLDNYTTAMPLLEQYGWPATFYIPTQNITDGELFWWEALDYLFWHRRVAVKQWAPVLKAAYLPDTDDVCFDHADHPLESCWSANTMPPPTGYCRFYLEISAYIKAQSRDRQQTIARQLAALDPDGAVDAQNRFKKMSSSELRALCQRGFEPGAHSVHHPALGLQEVPVQREEIMGSKARLEALTGRPVTTFAYPHGHYSATTKALVQEAGFSTACTTAGGAVFPDSDPLCLPRLWVKDWPAEIFQQQLDQYFGHKKSVR